jgi:hypothetical protein
VINLTTESSTTLAQHSTSVLEILTGRHASALALSPDGKYLACAMPATTQSASLIRDRTGWWKP